MKTLDPTARPAAPQDHPENQPSASLSDRLRHGMRDFLPEKEKLSFADLYDTETRHLDAGNPPLKGAGKVQVLKGPAGEPAIRFTPHDRFGLALSGGGIRSATFNLGVLQTLSRVGILSRVDYLATVSGGGYVGGFWTAWLHRDKSRAGHFPAGFDERSGERAEIRHLREFSRFLLPRMGFFETEFWGIMMTVLGGMVPSLLTALAVLGVWWYIWLAGLIALTLPGWQGAGVSALAALFYLAKTEIDWRNGGRAEQNTVETAAYMVASLLTGTIIFLQIRRGALPVANLEAWSTFSEFKSTMALPVMLGICTLILLFIRVLAARFFRSPKCIPCLVGVERCAMRMLGVTAGMTVVAALWFIAAFLAREGNQLALKATSAGTGVMVLVFAWAKKWLTEPVQETKGGSFVQFLISWLKRATPKALSTLVWLLLFVLVGSLVHMQGDAQQTVLTWKFWMPFAACGTLIGLVAFFFDPARVGMHEFYRSRISRCYLGASNISTDAPENDRAALNRHTAERPKDDVTLGEMREIPRPIHLVCVAANDMSGDQLGNLYRGARSAVLSGNGISLGDETARLDHLRLSAALTASAAAFNSQMGRVSMDLGRSVAFLMSALNLRLGLWVPHPDNRFRGNYIFPGRFFLSELVGMSRTDRQNLHLSDGNHFENFGLYELVRRHCRYIVVSDCGADREVAFDDLANVLRRVREDFGVEIELDVAPLRPDENNRAKQHAVVGTIHYDGMAGVDKGTILYFKPCLTGDEPPDVLQYSTRNGEFPHEGTADQFYDEAQWESYRRLGEHATDSVLGFFEPSSATSTNAVDRLFRDARARWHPTPDDLEMNFLEMSERCAALEESLINDGPRQLYSEFFVEASALAQSAKPTTGRNGDTPTAPDPDLDIQILSYLVRIVQIMEDIWVSASLDRYWSHPLNEGWMNYFRRWAATPSFRRWWPVISSMYCWGFREFVCQRFHVGVKDVKSLRPEDAEKHLAHLNLKSVDDPKDFFAHNFAAQQFLQTNPQPSLEEYRVLAYHLSLLDHAGQPSPRSLAVGFVLVRERPARPAEASTWIAEWQAEHLFIPESLAGSGFSSKFLDAVLRFYQTPGAVPDRTFRGTAVHFGFGADDKLPNRATRYERVRDIEFYKSRNFSYVNSKSPGTGPLTLQRLW